MLLSQLPSTLMATWLHCSLLLILHQGLLINCLEKALTIFSETSLPLL